MNIPCAEGWKLRVIGAQLVVLHDVYDERQFWLPFVQAIICEKRPPEGAPQNATQRRQERKARTVNERLAKQWSNKFIDPGGTARHLYEHVKDRPQLPLPFPEHRKISVKEWKRVTLAEHPYFERMTDGRIPMITFAPPHEEVMRAWCHENARGRYHCTRNTATFQLVVDAVHAKLAIPL